MRVSMCAYVHLCVYRSIHVCICVSVHALVCLCRHHYIHPSSIHASIHLHTHLPTCLSIIYLSVWLLGTFSWLYLRMDKWTDKWMDAPDSIYIRICTINIL